MNPKLAIAALFVVALLSGCFNVQDGELDATTYAALGYSGDDPEGDTPESWPKLNGTTLTILDHGAFSAFDDAARMFHALTGITVQHVEADDTGSAIQHAIHWQGQPEADVLYGIDNALLSRALEQDLLEPYTPLLASRVPARFLFFNASEPWPATPVDHGYIAINVDTHHPSLANKSVTNLHEVRNNAHLFVTQDPRTSSVGLGFMLATLATYGERTAYDWKDYWSELFDGGVLVTAGWTEAYEGHFSGGYGADYGGAADKPIVTSYTESPAYEHFYGRNASTLASVVLVPRSTFQQIQTMAILKGTPHLAAAQAWIEFALTDAFQEMAAPGNAVYPVVTSVNVTETYGGFDPAPGTFVPAQFASNYLGDNLERWIAEWVALCEANDCA